MDRAKYQAFVDDLNALVKKHGLMVYSTTDATQLEIAPIGSDEKGALVRLNYEENRLELDG